jgi:hypothetical protein
MKKSFLKHPLHPSLILAIDGSIIGRIAVQEEKQVENKVDYLSISSTYSLQLIVDDQAWPMLPTLAADLHLHRGDIGYMSKGAALAAARDILLNKGWINTTPTTK